MIEEWLQKIQQGSWPLGLRGVVSFALICLVLVGLVDIAGVIGFGNEISTHRSTIWAGIVVTASVLTISWLFRDVYQQKAALKKEVAEKEQQIAALKQDIDHLQQEKEELTKDRESLLQLMETDRLYARLQAREEVTGHLKRIAVFSLMAQQWQAKDARIERFRIERAQLQQGQFTTDLALRERVSILINLGDLDSVEPGMEFIIQDPLDLREYGRIVVKDVQTRGSICRIVDLQDESFWFDVLEILKTDVTRNIAAASNMFVPYMPLKDIDPECAALLRDWLPQVKGGL